MAAGQGYDPNKKSNWTALVVVLGAMSLGIYYILKR